MSERKVKTIEELKQWYKERGLPPYETTRFFIGMNIQEPKAFGIYKEGGEYIVYKNKDDGTRSVRYHGTDEEFAVNELLDRLKLEIKNQKGRGEQADASPVSKKRTNIFVALGIAGGIAGLSFIALMHLLAPVMLTCGIGFLLWLLILYLSGKISKENVLSGVKYKLFRILLLIGVIIVIFPQVLKFTMPRYYKWEEMIFCKYHSDYYVYTGYDYYPIDNLPSEVEESPSQYKMNSFDEYWDSDYDFFESRYYEDNFDSSDLDSDYDWDSDSWDSDSTDWGSDW